MLTFLYFTAIFFFMILCVVLSFVILIQESKSSGFGASFGGDAGSSLFGTSTADVLRKFTAYLSVIFLVSCLVLSFWTSAMGKSKVSTPSMIEEQEQDFDAEDIE